MNFRVETYTDSGLKPAEQRTLLRERAAAVLDLLTAGGADRKRLTMEAVSPENAPSRDDSQNVPPRGAVRLTLLESSEFTPNAESSQNR